MSNTQARDLTVPLFTSVEKRNIVFYIAGIMCYKFALESYNGTIKAFALDRFPESQRYTYNGYLDGFNQAAQCIGSILVAPLVRKFHTRTVLASAIFFFALISSLGMIIEAATGGKTPGNSPTGKAIAGSWDPRGVIPIFVIAGVAHGMIELIRRIIPRDIVGGNVIKLKKMDSLVHIFYEVAGTSGAFFATFIALQLGKAFAPVVTPFLYIVAAFLWSRIQVASADDEAPRPIDSVEEGPGIVAQIGGAFAAFGVAIYEGARIIFTERRFTWLIFGYSIPLVLHRYLENGLGANYAKLVLNESAYSSLLVGGSNFGELCGAFFVFVFTHAVKTPLPWLRLDAITLSITWVLYKITPAALGLNSLQTAWVIAAIFVPVSMGWAAGDVSLAAFIQSHVSRLNNTNPRVSPLGAVMAFLYVTYIVVYAVINPVIGQWLDRLPKADKTPYFFYIGGVMFTCTGVLIFISTFWPKGSWKFNPTLEEDYPEEEDIEEVGGFEKRHDDMVEQIVG
ncbi:hypothetical protein HK097_009892 [Rhizophlyctis rosea]|uniref:Uncharacterized protein n=1 Tax=Rhizophlyctis rosea TaxID=64517 RepID=A0AAD5S898_9FUNG|nr:hypothetical protein HK097_009892 [Rhizophlyctis rosea]